MNPLKVKSGYEFYWHNFKAIFSDKQFYGWGRKRSGRFAAWCAQTFKGKATLYEDGFIRSLGLGVDQSPAFSYVADSRGIYYDATRPSDLETLLNKTDFSNTELKQARQAIDFIQQHNLSKYNNAPFAPDDYLKSDNKVVLVVAQTAGDASLKYGLAERFSTQDLINAAINENPDADIVIKLHPDVLSDKKHSDITPSEIPQQCKLLTTNFNPISLLKQIDKVYTKTSQMGFEALLLGKEVVCFGMPFYAGWGLTDDRINIQRRQARLSVEALFAGAYFRYSHYFNPLTQKACDLFEVLQTIVSYRNKYLSAPRHAYFFGFSRWKHRLVTPFFDELAKSGIKFINPVISSPLDLAVKKGLLKNIESDGQVAFYIWGKKEFPQVEAFAKQHGINVYRVEDGFYRSNSLGSDLTQAYSLVVDAQGIYFDPSQPSDLEVLLQDYDFANTPDLLAKAQSVREYWVKQKLSKYNHFADQNLNLPKDKKIIVVPGQVGDDASIRYGANGMSNLTLLQKVRHQRPDGFIVFKPHPDVVVGNRAGAVSDSDALQYCDLVVTDLSIDSVLRYADEVHTMTSLVGFEALLREIKVFTYGMPFYAGWGLTIDGMLCERRTRELKLEELVAATLLLYPRYISPFDKKVSSLQVVFQGLEAQSKYLASHPMYRLRVHLRNSLVRFFLKLGRKVN